MAPTPRRPRSFGRWPFGLLAVAVLRLINAIALIQVGLSGIGNPTVGLPILVQSATLTRSADLMLAGLTLLGIVGLLLFQRWGWVLTMVLVGVALLGDLIRIAIGAPDYLGLFIHVLTAFYLNGRSVRALAGQALDNDPVHSP